MITAIQSPQVICTSYIISSSLFRIFHELFLLRALLQFSLFSTFSRLNVSQETSSDLTDWCGIVFVGVEVTVQSKERISIKGCCASLRDSDSHIPCCRVSVLYSRPPISPPSPFPTTPCCQSFSLAVLIFLAFLFFSFMDIFDAATDFVGQKIYVIYLIYYYISIIIYRRFSTLVVRAIITVHWSFKKRDKTEYERTFVRLIFILAD